MVPIRLSLVEQARNQVDRLRRRRHGRGGPGRVLVTMNPLSLGRLTRNAAPQLSIRAVA